MPGKSNGTTHLPPIISEFRSMTRANTNSSLHFWFFIVSLALAGYISQTSRSSDLMGSIDGASVSLLMVSVCFLSSLIGRRFSAVICALIVVCSLVLVVGNRFYLELYQSFVPSSILQLAPESLALIKSFPFWLTLSVMAFVMGIALIIYKLIVSVNLPGPGLLLLAAVSTLAGSLVLQLWHDSRSFKHFSSYSESPTGYFF
jgi:hypothetical protein